MFGERADFEGCHLASSMNGAPIGCLPPAGLVLYLVYLLLEKALVGWVTILVELVVAVILMLYKVWLDHCQRYALTW